MSEYHSAFHTKAKELLPDWQYDQLRSAAIPTSGANARWKASGPSAFEKLALSVFSPDQLRSLEDKELKTVLRRLNKMCQSAKRTKKDASVFAKAARHVVKEMRDRNLTYDQKLMVLQEMIDKEDVEKNGYAEPSDYPGPPISPRGYTVEESSQMVQENGPFPKEQANYITRADYPHKACAGCRFFLRGSNGCELVEGNIDWFATCDLFISVVEDTCFKFNAARVAVQEAMMDTALGVQKATSMGGSDDDNNTDPKPPKVFTVKQLIDKMIKHEGGKWVVTSQDGSKVLGTYGSKAEAVKRLRDIEGHKAGSVEKGGPTVNQVHQPGSDGKNKKKDDEEQIAKQIMVPIAKIDEEKRRVYGIVLEPDDVDTQGDTISADEIEKAAESFMRGSRTIGLRHRKNAEGAYLTDSYVTQGPHTLGKTKLKPGTWVIGVKLEDDSLWEGVKNGEFTGFSVGGVGNRSKNA